MTNIFLTSDTHFSHVGVTQFKTDEGRPLRPWDNITDMDEAMIQNWNKVVRPNDKVYHLGDVVINRKALALIHRLNGDKVLIKGNHDIFRINEYLEHFREVRAYHILDKYVMSHIPIHPDSLARWCNGNIHGHLHSNLVRDKWGKPDPRYICVCVEHTNFTPIPFEEIRNGWRPKDPKVV